MPSASVHEFAFVNFSKAAGLRGIPPAKAWKVMCATNEDRLLDTAETAIFINAKGTGNGANKFVVDANWSSDEYPGYKLFHHTNGTYKPLLVRAIPSHNAVLSVEVDDDGTSSTVTIKATFMSGRVAYEKDYPCIHRLRALNFKDEVRRHLVKEGMASVNTQLRLVMEGAVSVLRGNTLIWPTRQIPISPAIPRRIAHLLGAHVAGSGQAGGRVAGGARVGGRSRGGSRSRRTVATIFSSADLRRWMR